MEVWPPRSWVGLVDGQDREREKGRGRQPYPDVKVEVAVGNGSESKILFSGWGIVRGIDALDVESNGRYRSHNLAYLPSGSEICLNQFEDSFQYLTFNLYKSVVFPALSYPIQRSQL